MPARRTPKVEALVVNAIRRLQDVQGSTSREISNYISQEYNVPSEETRRQVQFTLRRGLSYGILKRSKGGYYSYDHDYLRQLSLGNGTGDEVTEPCPAQPWRFGVRKRKREKARRRRYARERRERLRREGGRKRRTRRRGSRTRRRRRGRRRRSRTRVRRGRRRPSRSRRRTRRGRRRSRRRGKRSGARARTRANPGEMEMEATSPVLPKRDDTDRKDEEPRNSETSVSEHSERHSQNSSQNSQSLNQASDDI
ncbi:PREDICTED: arginine/serine-rich coiled-coil protein 2-like [Wasmannia auropunctata]|uniref:arginine/serine-rich coiled-coil protein 2-like n=1 Tax=Wasmannia auropunctata TaxID=64793 RepID=UPI0005F0BDE2|nr:PREDICTED: arginine/serine-rich coiled-coil protein 2-like [Wasmannia auropunctata]XP_011691230.1 PREDICTED: arginine/serine-rich coiled-coil protein 2-like [Wasmannia auropunctata]